MTDKQIIIDGIDVSGCDELVNECDCYLTQEHDYRSSTPYTYNKCSGFPNCYYKQLKAKEQECERLKLDLIEAKAHGDYLNNLALSKTLDTVSGELDQLKAYNKQLEKENLHYRNQFAMQYMSITVDGKEVYCGPVKRLEKTLQKIKEIAENAYCLTNGINKDMANFAKQILQKISECEVTNDMENN